MEGETAMLWVRIVFCLVLVSSGQNACAQITAASPENNHTLLPTLGPSFAHAIVYAVYAISTSGTSSDWPAFTFKSKWRKRGHFTLIHRVSEKFYL